LKDRNRELAQL